MNLKKLISLSVLTCFILSSSNTIAVEPTTFPTNKQGPRIYPGSIWKTDQTNKKTGKSTSKSSSTSKTVTRKGQKEAGVLVEPTLSP